MMKHGSSDVNENGFIVIETNYRIYAYTSMCSLFAVDLSRVGLRFDYRYCCCDVLFTV